MGIGILLIVLSYLIGSIPFGLIIGKSVGKDIRESGSGNIGSTNVVRTLGLKLGLLSAVCDILKGTIIIILVYLFEYLNIWYNPFVINGDSLYALYGLAAVIGHCYPIYLKFKGGKAVACSFGFLLSTNIILFFIALVTIIVVVLVKKYVSLGSMVSIFLASVFSLLPTFRDTMNFYLDNYSYMYSFTLFVITAFVVIRHKKNLIRLLKGEENKVKI